MRNMMWIGVLLIGLGVAGLVIQNVTWTETEEVVDIGPLELNAEEEHSMPIPTIAGVIAVLAGVVLIFASRRGA
jgi:hypothetical protein